MKIKEIFLFMLLFITLLITGLAVVDDYGISWDEYRNRINGFFSYNYLVNDDYSLFNYQDRYYGVAFDLPLIVAEKLLGLRTFRHIFLMRHYATFLFFYCSCLIFYFLSKRMLNSIPLAFTAVGLLAISPRIFADAFYNSKDIVFMGMFIIAVYTMMIFLEKMSAGSALLHAAASAYLTDIRVMGIMVPFLTIAWVLFQTAGTGRTVVMIKRTLLYLVAYAGLTTLLWPYLWPAPLGNFTDAFIHMSRYPNAVETLYRGKTLMTDALPWHYLPVWMAITIPPVYTFFFVTGASGILAGLIRGAKSDPAGKTEDLLVMAWFFGPVILVVVLGSTLYDAWRQVFFIYPAFVLLSAKGLKSILKITSRWGGRLKPILRAGLISCLTVQMVLVLWFMIKNHPHGNVYFNILAGKNYDGIKNRFEMDYWGLAYRQALETILKTDRREEITVFAANDPGVINSFILPEKERKRLWYVIDPREADYFITNYRWRKTPYDLDNEVFSVKVKGAKIVSVFRLDRSPEKAEAAGRFRGRFFEYFDDASGIAVKGIN
ncbi:MAG: hypothetical protein AB1724_18385 [Thermodesulfobacteriota bacterium]